MRMQKIIFFEPKKHGRVVPCFVFFPCIRNLSKNFVRENLSLKVCNYPIIFISLSKQTNKQTNKQTKNVNFCKGSLIKYIFVVAAQSINRVKYSRRTFVKHSKIKSSKYYRVKLIYVLIILSSGPE